MDVQVDTIDSDDQDSVDLVDDTDTDTDTDFETKSSQLEPNVIGDYCCQKKCLSMFNDDFKSRLKSDLLKIPCKEKKIYLFALISKKFNMNNKMSLTQFDYTVKEYGISRSVCRNAFIILHDTTPGLVRSLCNKISTNYVIPSVNRRLNVKYSTIPQETRELIKSHFHDVFKSPNIIQYSKKSRNQSSILQLWLDFKQKYPNSYVSYFTFSKYIHLDITPEVLKEFKCQNKVRKILTENNRSK